MSNKPYRSYKEDTDEFDIEEELAEEKLEDFDIENNDKEDL